MKLSWLCRNAKWLAVFFGLFISGNALAIGAWQVGMVTQSPWKEQGYQHVKIDQVKYTIMPGAKCEFAYIANGATQKEPQDIMNLRIGDKVTMMVEGNRIYQIEKTR